MNSAIENQTCGENCFSTKKWTLLWNSMQLDIFFVLFWFRRHHLVAVNGTAFKKHHRLACTSCQLRWWPHESIHYYVNMSHSTRCAPLKAMTPHAYKNVNCATDCTTVMLTCSRCLFFHRHSPALFKHTHLLCMHTIGLILLLASLSEALG